MTPAEKAGQLTQYFYFGACPSGRRAAALGLDADSQPAMVEAALGRGEVGLAAVRHRPGGDQPPAAARRRGQPARHPGAVRLRRDPRAAHDPPGADRDGGVVGPRRPIERGQAVAAREARAVGIHWTFAPMVDIARDPRWGRIIEGAGEDPYLGAAVAAAQVRGFQGDAARRPGARHRRAQALRRLRRRARRARLRRGQPLRLRAVERLLPAVRGGGRGRRRQRDDRLHGPQRHPGHRQPLAVHRRAARDAGASRASSSATPTPSATS